jgi:hypothetical protein
MGSSRTYIHNGNFIPGQGAGEEENVSHIDKGPLPLYIDENGKQLS